MSPLEEAKRFLWLWLRAEGVQLTTEDPVELLRNLVEHTQKYGVSNSLYRENQSLKGTITDLEARLSEAQGKHHVLAAQIHRLEAALEQATQCQTLVRNQVASMKEQKPSPECEPDLLSDPTFVPCRNERCGRQGLHAVGTCALMGRAPRKRKDRSDNA